MLSASVVGWALSTGDVGKVLSDDILEGQDVTQRDLPLLIHVVSAASDDACGGAAGSSAALSTMWWQSFFVERCVSHVCHP